MCMVGLKSRAFAIMLVATAWKTVDVQAGVNVMNATTNAIVAVCKNGCGKLYKDWYGELVCPICGYHEYTKEDYESYKNFKI